jgi:hypothetical protein
LETASFACDKMSMLWCAIIEMMTYQSRIR